MRSPTSASVGRRGLAAVAALVALTPFAIGAMAASADPPPAAAGTTSHGFLVDRGAVTTIDHPKATTIPPPPTRRPGPRRRASTITARSWARTRAADRVVRHFVRDRRGRYTRSRIPLAEATRRVRRHQQPRRDRRLLQRRPGSHDNRLPAHQEGTVRRHQRPGLSGDRGVEDQRPAAGRRRLRRRRGRRRVHGFRLGRRRVHHHRRPRRRRDRGPRHQQPRADWSGPTSTPKARYHGFLRDGAAPSPPCPRLPAPTRHREERSPLASTTAARSSGLAYDAQGGSRGFLFERGKLTTIDRRPGRVYTRPLDIDDSGRIVGDYGTRPRR